MKGKEYYKLLKVIIEFKDNDKFFPSDLEKKAEMKYITINKYLNKITDKFSNCINKDTKRHPYEYTLLNRSLLIELLIKDILPEFLHKHINLNQIQNDKK